MTQQVSNTKSYICKVLQVKYFQNLVKYANTNFQALYFG